MPKFTIIVDDDDRDQCPDKPWSAYCHDDGVGSCAGLGTTPEEAVRDLLSRPDGFAPTYDRLECLRTELRAQRISYGELAELQDLSAHIDPGDVELLEAAGVPEHKEEN